MIRHPVPEDPRGRRLRSAAVRAGGVLLLALAWYIGQLLKQALVDDPPHEATALEFVLALLSFVLASGGGMLLIHGGSLFRREDGPRRP